ncbi:hypothetical protein [Gaoshiqia sp. Z1-71]|uniref:hypothetical protein n=1 Tax=Gaoshiqia hydrogeniformans TaxID=3290090 RepID=UPI003BF7EEE2
MDKQLLNIDKNLPVKPSVTTDEKVRVFQRKLYQRAKQEKSFKAYSLYDKVCQAHVLREAYRRVKAGKQEYEWIFRKLPPSNPAYTTQVE